MTPRCAAAAAVVSAVVLRRPTKEYTHRYSMMHRRFTTAGIEVAPHYHQLLVVVYYSAVFIVYRGVPGGLVGYPRVLLKSISRVHILFDLI